MVESSFSERRLRSSKPYTSKQRWYGLPTKDDVSIFIMVGREYEEEKRHKRLTKYLICMRGLELGGHGVSTLSLWHRYTLSPGSLAKHVPSISSKPRSILVGNNLAARICRTRVHRTRFPSRTLPNILIIKDLRGLVLSFIIASVLRHCSAR